jgi:acyl-CoA synthetase (AMP-forming)/AMP-acid ligase II
VDVRDRPVAARRPHGLGERRADQLRLARIGGVGTGDARAEAPTLDELVAFLCRREIAAFKLPERLGVLDAFPLSPIGKVSKRDLVARFS